MMFVSLNSLTFTGTRQAAQKEQASNQLVSMLNQKAVSQSPLEAAKQALLEAKNKLDQQRDDRIENALAGYRFLRSRQTSYEEQLGVQQNQLENYQALSNRADALNEELSAARADYATYAATETTLDITQHNRLALRVSSLERELASVDADISALVDRANRYASSQRKYAAYLEETGQDGYAAYQYQGQGEFTRANFVSETSGFINRLEAGVKQWRENVSNYCEQYGLTPYDFESYVQERQKLGNVYFNAKNRLAELLYFRNDAVSSEEHKAQAVADNTAVVENNLDSVEISRDAREQAGRIYSQTTNGIYKM